MTHSVWFILVTVSAAVTLGHPTDQGPQTFQGNSKPQQSYQEVIMYLTPSQIRALEQGHKLDEKAILSQNPHINSGLLKNVQQFNNEQFRKQLEQQQQKIQTLLQELAKQNSRLQAFKNYTEKQNTQLNTQKPRYNNEQYKQMAELLLSSNQDKNKLYFKTDLPQFPSQFQVDANLLSSLDSIKQPLLQQELPERSTGGLFRPEEFLKVDQSQSQPPEQSPFVFDPLLQQKFQLIPYDYLAKQQREHQQLGEKLLTENHIQLFRLPANQQKQLQKQFEQQLINKEQERVTHLDLIKQQQDLKFQYAPTFNDRRYTSDVQSALKSLYFDGLKSKAEEEAIADAPPIVIHKDITIKKHRPNVLIKSINVPVSTPFLVPYPQPYEVKYPQPYAVPVEIIKPYAVPIVKTEKIEVEKPVPVEVEKRVPVEVERKVYVKVDKPYSVDRIVPVEVKKEIPVEVPLFRPEKLTILRHIWQN